MVYEDAASVGFLDRRPLFHGHTLLVPRHHYATLHELPSEWVETFFVAAQRVAVAVRWAMDAEGYFFAMNNVVSQSVPHFHAHIVPRRRRDGLRGFFWPRQKYESDEQLEQVRRAIAAALKDGGDNRGFG